MTTKTYIADTLTSILFFCLLGPAFGAFILMATNSPRNVLKATAFVLPFAYIIGFLPAFIAGFINGVFVSVSESNGIKIDMPDSIFIGGVIGSISVVLFQFFVLGNQNFEKGTLKIVGAGAFSAAICAGIVNRRLRKTF